MYQDGRTRRSQAAGGLRFPGRPGRPGRSARASETLTLPDGRGPAGRGGGLAAAAAAAAAPLPTHPLRRGNQARNGRNPRTVIARRRKRGGGGREGGGEGGMAQAQAQARRRAAVLSMAFPHPGLWELKRSKIINRLRCLS